METTKRKAESRTKENWVEAKRQAKQMGIVHCELRKEKNRSLGRFFCFYLHICQKSRTFAPELQLH